MWEQEYFIAAAAPYSRFSAPCVSRPLFPFFPFFFVFLFFASPCFSRRERVATLHRRTDSSWFSDFAERLCAIFFFFSAIVTNTTESRGSFLFESRTATGIYFCLHFTSFRHFCYFYRFLFFFGWYWEFIWNESSNSAEISIRKYLNTPAEYSWIDRISKRAKHFLLACFSLPMEHRRRIAEYIPCFFFLRAATKQGQSQRPLLSKDADLITFGRIDKFQWYAFEIEMFHYQWSGTLPVSAGHPLTNFTTLYPFEDSN